MLKRRATLGRAVLLVAILFAPGVARSQQTLIIDHTCIGIDQIPDEWLDQARNLVFHYAHTSHGHQIVAGLQYLASQDSRYALSVDYAGSNPPSTLPCAPDHLCIYDGNPPETYIEPTDYWSTSSGISRTEAVAGTGLFGFSMWSWCGQQSTNPSTVVQQYLDTLSTFESDFVQMRFILMTGHTDGGGATLQQNNEQVRQYAIDHDMVLFDFADIESWDPDGGYYPDTDDGCPWCQPWCDANPGVCPDPPIDCDHSHSLVCDLKGRAFWWMAARLAGWEGPDSAPIFNDGFESGSCGEWTSMVP